MNDVSSTDTHQHEDLKSATSTHKNIVGIAYVFEILAIITGGLTLVIAAIVAYFLRPKVQTTWLASHCEWQLKTALYILPIAVIGALTMQLILGYIALLTAAIWLAYRVGRGWSYFIKNEPMVFDKL